MADDEKLEQDDPKDEAVDDTASSKKSSATDKKSSQKEVTPETDIEKEVQKRVSDILAKRGDKAKTLEDRVNELETRNQELVKRELVNTASKYGISAEQLENLGITDPDKLENIATLFASKKETATDTKKTEETKSKGTPLSTADSGVTSGDTGEWTPEKVKGLSPEELIKNAKEISNLPLTI